MDGSDSSTTKTQSVASEHAPAEPTPEPDASPRAHAPALELGVWLLALRSFLNLRNHPLGPAESADLTHRDFTPETRLARQTLRRCLRLAVTLPPTDDPDAAAAHSPALVEVLGDAHGLCEALLAAPQVAFQAWATFSRLLARTLDASEPAQVLMRRARAQTLFELQPELFSLTERLTPDALGADMHVVFTRLACLLEDLRLVEAALRRDAPLKQMLPLFTLAHEEARTLIELIEQRALRAGETESAVGAALDSASYAVGMELYKVYARELVGLAALRDPTVAYARVENAHGLLRDCFQQLVVALAQAFDPAFDGRRLFANFRTRLEQSLALRRDLWALLTVMRRTEQATDRPALAPLFAQLNAFQTGSMAHLMYKDWDAFERFVQELKDAAEPAEQLAVLHRFTTFLEALFGQINMRAVLAEHPFDYPPDA
ncbi:MAG TPA: hypothetical protein VF546_07070 [Pyrinomonadaceae bacterium]